MTDPALPLDDSSGEDTELAQATPPGGAKTITVFLTERGMDTQQVDVPRHTSLEDSDKIVQANPAERYAVGDELARGGMGAVLTAKDLNLRRDVAMKIVLNPKAAKDAQIVRFVHEAQVTGQLEHPSIVPVHELGVDADENLYYTMKFIRGLDLGDILKGIRERDEEMLQKYPLQRLLNIYIKACEALAFAHSRGVIHRDLKPDNLMVGDFGEVLIVDWGLAKVLKDVESELPEDAKAFRAAGAGEANVVESVRDTQAGMNTMDGAVMGTPAYMPPEQADGDLIALGPLSDVYSMGAILHTILTLEPPVKGKAVDEVLEKVRAGEIEVPDLQKGSYLHCPQGRIPAPLAAVATKAMAHDLNDRYASVQDLQADVQAYQDGFATDAEDAGLWRLVQLFVARHKALVISGLTAFILLTVVIAVAFVINLQARQTAERERGAAFIARGEAESALQAFKAEQARGIESRKTAAPAMIEAAQNFIEKGKLGRAATQVALAREYNPDLAAGHMLAAQLWIVDGDYAKALEALAAYRALRPDDDAALQLTALCREADVKTEDELHVAFAEVFSAKKAWQLADHLSIDQDKAFELYSQRLAQAWPKCSFKRRSDGLLDLEILPTNISDLSPLKGMPIGRLDLTARKEISDLSPLRGMPLRELYIPNTKVTDLGPLTGAPLTRLNAVGTRVRDLSPLAGMPLEQLHLGGTQVSDLSPLQGAPLKSLTLGSTQVSDLSPLKGMSLTGLSLIFARQVTNISALAGMPLKNLHLAHTAALKDLSPLAFCTSLEKLDLDANGSEDLTPLQGLPLKTLKLRGLSSLAPLVGLPLEELTLTDCPIHDLSALRGMPLRSLTITAHWAVGITDLSPLRGMPLEALRIRRCNGIEDFSVIATLKSLRHLTLPEQFEAVDLLDDLPHLKSVEIGERFRGSPEKLRAHRAKREREKATEAQP